MHVPDRVLRQFTLSQHVPDPVEQILRRRRPTSHHNDWAVVRAAYIDRWAHRWDFIQDTRPTAVDYTAYIRWYWDITRRWITRDPQPLAGYMLMEPALRMLMEPELHMLMKPALHMLMKSALHMLMEPALRSLTHSRILR